MDTKQGDQGGSIRKEVSPNALYKEAVGADETNIEDSIVRKLQRENHLLRLQLLKLREQHRSLQSQAAAAGLSFCTGTAHLSSRDTAAEKQHAPSAPSPDTSAGGLMLPSSPYNPDDEAAVVRARTLQRQEQRQQRTTSARALVLGTEQPCDKLDCVQEQKQYAPSNEATLQTATASTNSATAGAAFNVSALRVPTAPQCLPVDTLRGGKGATEDDMSAQAMLQRFQNRKAQRRLRLEQMLGPGYDSGAAEDAGPETTPFANPAGNSTSVHEDGMTSHANNIYNSSDVIGAAMLDSEAALDETVCASSGGLAVDHRATRVGEAIGGPRSPPTGPTRNPNQIGRVVTDAVKNNSWYLCKVLEAALLDTIQARHVDVASPMAASTSFSQLPQPSPVQQPTETAHKSTSRTTSLLGAVASQSDARRVEERDTSGTTTPAASYSSQLAGVTPTSPAPPQLLYQLGVSDTALRRAIDESLVLSFRCIHDAPQRLTTQQAADEAVPPFEAENKDSELRRCFTSHPRRHSADCGGISGNAKTGTDDDNNSIGGLSPARADDESLDPFARLLLARISAELPSNNAKGDKKHKDSRGVNSSNGKQCDNFPQGLHFDPGERGGPLIGGVLGKGAPLSSPSTVKTNAAFVMAAPGRDGKVYIPKKHFSRLDEVQVEMHAPVIFNQIRSFLRLDVDRFRRSFLQSGTCRVAAADACSGTSADATQPFCFSAQQQQWQPTRTGGGGGYAAGTDDATAWRISVSPGKSGTTLLYFGDYVMKTVRSSEMEFFTRKYLPAYVRYCERNPHTLLPRFYALVTVRWWKAGMTQHFVLMHNVFATPYYIHRIYDVKGSTVNRTALQPGKPPPRTAFGALLLKDNDLPPQLIICGAYQRAILLAQFRSDVGFLRQLSVVDYSCMIGVRSRLFSREEGPSKTIVLQRHQHHDNDAPYVDPLGGGEVPVPLKCHQRSLSEITNVTSAAADAGAQTITVAINGAGTIPVPSLSSSDRQATSEDDVYVCIHGCDGGLLSLPIYAPGDDTTAREDVYYLGIIDVLQTYNSAKKLESFAKGFVNDRQAISVIPPDSYSERLYKVLERITV